MAIAELTPLQPFRNLADLQSASTARTNLALAIGTDVQAYSAQLASVASLATNGGLYRTAANTITARTITGTANQVTVTNGDGVSGNPTLSLPQSIATTSDLTFASVTATDGTTFSGASALPNLVAIKTFTATSGSYGPMFSQANANPSGSSSAQVRGLSYIVRAEGANNLTNSTGGLVGFRSDIQHLGTSVVTASCGALIGSPFRTSTGTWTTCYGVRIQGQKATGVTTGYAIYAEGANDMSYYAHPIIYGGSSAPTLAADQAATFGVDAAAGNCCIGWKTENGQTGKLYTVATYTPTNVTTDRSYDANATTLDEVADVLGTLIADLQLTGLLA